ncbi:MAG TPA: phosphatase PAP2 family protein [Chthoniobacteraceae bacterium]|nr:phosphatase PAP2 family protein [Chthoniobacteraceae bacterium]
MLAGILVAVVFAWLFAEVADEVLEGERQHWDEMVLLSLRQANDRLTPIGPSWMMDSAKDLTALGGVTIITFVNVAAFGYLALRGKWNSFWLMVLSVIGGAIGTTVLKDLFGRTRPSVVPHLVEVNSASFPSGHSMLAAVTYLTIGAMLARAADGTHQKVYIITLAILVTLIIGLTRIYLGVHYPSDVLGGWCAGISWALLCLLIAKFLERAGVVRERSLIHGRD